MAKKACRVGTVSFKTGRGRKVSFKGHIGAGCGPRPKPKTGHLAPYKAAFRAAAKSCKRAGGAKAFRRCMGDAVKSHSLRR